MSLEQYASRLSLPSEEDLDRTILHLERYIRYCLHHDGYVTPGLEKIYEILIAFNAGTQIPYKIVRPMPHKRPLPLRDESYWRGRQ